MLFANMDERCHDSVRVSPLHIRKAKRGPMQDGAIDTHEAACNVHRSAGQMTPPLTPSDAGHSFNDFQVYLRAFYHYHPQYEAETSTVTLPLNTGDLILVHSIHTNGWADGTLLSSGARGWLPTNYCEGYQSEPTSTLMRALTIFWDLVKTSARRGDYSAVRNSDYVRGIVAGVRCLLVILPCHRLGDPANEEPTGTNAVFEPRVPSCNFQPGYSQDPQGLVV